MRAVAIATVPVAAAVLGAFSTPASGAPGTRGTWHATGSMHVARSQEEGVPQAAQLSDGRVLWVGDGGDNKAAEIYDPATGSWSVTGSLNAARSVAAVAALPGGRALAAGGIGPGTIPENTAEIWEPASGRWHFTDPPPLAPLGGGEMHWAVLDSGKVLVQPATAEQHKAELYDPATHHWLVTGPAGGHDDGATLTALPGGRALLLGGLDPQIHQATSRADLFDEATMSWKWIPGPPGIVSISDQSATQLADGSILVASGALGPGSPAVTQAFLFDPSPSAPRPWLPVGPPATPHGERTGLTAVPCGALLTGGTINQGPALADAELYVAAAHAWTPVAPMGTARSGHVLTAVGDGTILAAGTVVDTGTGTVPGESADAGRTAELFTLPPCPAVVTGVTPPWGPTDGGTPVTVTGNGFTTATAIAFGDAPAIARCPAAPCFTVESDGVITVASPPHAAGSVHVIVTTPGEASPATPLDVFEYRGVSGCVSGCHATCPPTCPPPAITSIDPTSGLTAGGTQIALTGTGLTGAQRVHFAGVGTVSTICPPGGGGASACFANDPVNPDGQITVYSPAASAPGQVHITVDTLRGALAQSSNPTPADLFRYYVGRTSSGTTLSARTAALALPRLESTGFSAHGGLLAASGGGGGGGTPPAPPSLPGQAPVPVQAPVPMPGSFTVTNVGLAASREEETKAASETTHAMVGRDPTGVTLLAAAGGAGAAGATFCCAGAGRRRLAAARRAAPGWAR